MSDVSFLRIEAEQVTPQAWRNGGGQTRELLAWPDAANWQLRISRADIEKDGPFSAFPGVQRWFAVLSGAGVVLHMPNPATNSLQELYLHTGQPPLPFDGGLAPGCNLLDGATQDLNLMARGGQALMQLVQADTPWLASHSMCGLYTVQSGIWHCGMDSVMLPTHSLLWWPAAPAAAQRFTPVDSSQALQAYWLAYTPETSA